MEDLWRSDTAPSGDTASFNSFRSQTQLPEMTQHLFTASSDDKVFIGLCSSHSIFLTNLSIERLITALHLIIYFRKWDTLFHQIRMTIVISGIFLPTYAIKALSKVPHFYSSRIQFFCLESQCSNEIKSCDMRLKTSPICNHLGVNIRVNQRVLIPPPPLLLSAAKAGRNHLNK